MFWIVGFLTRQILGFVSSQTKTNRILSLVGILTNLSLTIKQSNNLGKLIFVTKNWPNDTRVGCTIFNNLVCLIVFELDLEQEINEF
jgi:hypothetical protein